MLSSTPLSSSFLRDREVGGEVLLLPGGLSSLSPSESEDSLSSLALSDVVAGGPLEGLEGGLEVAASFLLSKDEEEEMWAR